MCCSGRLKASSCDGRRLNSKLSEVRGFRRFRSLSTPATIRSCRTLGGFTVVIIWTISTGKPRRLTESHLVRGHVQHAGVPAHLADADVLVEPSVWDEPFGIPVVEAMASSLPVVATTVGGIPELVEHDRTGILVDRNDPTALADGILRIFQNAETEKMGKAGRARACALFSWESVTERLTTVYEALVSGRSIAS